MKHNLLFIQISEFNFDESLLISRFVSQLSGEVQVMCLVNGISSSLVSSNPNAIVGILTENQDDNLRRFQDVIGQSRPDAIVVLDLYKYFLNPMELNFLPVWLTDCGIPVMALDYYNLLTADSGQIRLQGQAVLPLFEAGEVPEYLELKAYLVKPVPPAIQMPGNDQVYYWNPFDPALGAAAPQLRQQVLDSLGAKAETRVITLLFDPTMLMQSLDQGLVSYYFMVVEVIIYYLRQFGGQPFQLLIIGSAPPTDQINEIADKNFEVHYFSHLTEDNYRALIAASDLLISNTNWSPALLDAAALGLPVCVMGNSVIQEWKDASETERELRSYFSPAPALFQLCEMFVQLNKWALSLPIFQFINYPHRYEEPEFPSVGLQSAGLPYFLFDMFDDESNLPLLQNLLFSQPAQQEYRDYCHQFMKASESGLSFQQILKRIEN